MLEVFKYSLLQSLVVTTILSSLHNELMELTIQLPERYMHMNVLAMAKLP